MAHFAIFENGHYAAGQAYFYEPDSKQIGEFSRMRGKVFIFFLSQGP